MDAGARRAAADIGPGVFSARFLLRPRARPRGSVSAALVMRGGTTSPLEGPPVRPAWGAARTSRRTCACFLRRKDTASARPGPKRGLAARPRPRSAAGSPRRVGGSPPPPRTFAKNAAGSTLAAGRARRPRSARVRARAFFRHFFVRLGLADGTFPQGQAGAGGAAKGRKKKKGTRPPPRARPGAAAGPAGRRFRARTRVDRTPHAWRTRRHAHLAARQTDLRCGIEAGDRSRAQSPSRGRAVRTAVCPLACSASRAQARSPRGAAPAARRARGIAKTAGPQIDRFGAPPALGRRPPRPRAREPAGAACVGTRMCARSGLRGRLPSPLSSRFRPHRPPPPPRRFVPFPVRSPRPPLPRPLSRRGPLERGSTIAVYIVHWRVPFESASLDAIIRGIPRARARVARKGVWRKRKEGAGRGRW